MGVECIHLIWYFGRSYARIFYELRSISPNPAGARKNASNYRPKHRIRGLLFHCILFLLRSPSPKKKKKHGQTRIVQCNALAYFARSLALIW